MEYPFQFKELLITSQLLDVLGFSEYWAGCGDFGDRRLDLGGKVGDDRLVSKKEYPMYFIYVIDETDDPMAGYGDTREYCTQHCCTNGFKENLYFIHEMYDDIVARRTPEEVDAFIELTKKKGVNVYPYIESYLKFKNK